MSENPYMAVVEFVNYCREGDRDVATYFRTHATPVSQQMFQALSEAGSGTWIAAILSACVIALAWRRHWYSLAALLLTVPGGLLANLVLKSLFQRHRPFRIGDVTSWDAYSFPSGHTAGATLLYGILLIAIFPMLRRRRWRALATAAAILVVLLVGLSRVALCMHFVTDVIGAVVFSLLWLCLCLITVHGARRIQRSMFVSTV